MAIKKSGRPVKKSKKLGGGKLRKTSLQRASLERAALERGAMQRASGVDDEAG